jgi:hypothetical protein
MTYMTYAQSSRFLVGTALSKSFEVMFRNIVPFGIIALLMTLPKLALDYYSFEWTFGLQENMFDPNTINSTNVEELEGTVWKSFAINALNLALLALAWALCTAAMSFGTYETLRGRPATLDQCLQRGLPMVIPALLIGFLLILGLGLASLLLVIPGLILAMVWYVVIPVAVVERPGIFAAFSRSAELTRGNRWRIFGIYLISAAIGWALGIPMIAATFIFYGDAMILSGISWIITAASLVVGAVMTSVVYYYLRIALEGGSIEDIAEVFD